MVDVSFDQIFNVFSPPLEHIQVHTINSSQKDGQGVHVILGGNAILTSQQFIGHLQLLRGSPDRNACSRSR